MQKYGRRCPWRHWDRSEGRGSEDPFRMGWGGSVGAEGGPSAWVGDLGPCRLTLTSTRHEWMGQTHPWVTQGPSQAFLGGGQLSLGPC